MIIIIIIIITAVVVVVVVINNNEYLERLTRTGPKRLHVLYKYILSKFNAYNMNAHTHTNTHRLAYALI